MEKSLDLEPNNAELHFTLGALYYDAGKEQKSIEAMKTTIRLNPEHANALNYLGYTYAEKGINLEEALNLITKALSIKPESGHIIDSLGWVYYQMGEIEKAVQELERAAKFLPDDPAVLEHLGDAYLKIGQKEKALDMYEKASKLDAKNVKLKEKLERLRKGIKKDLSGLSADNNQKPSVKKK